jgi:hypothetical protein
MIRGPPPPVELSPTWLRTGRLITGPLVVRQFPPEVAFGFLGRVLPTTEPVELRVEARRLAPDRALEILHSARAVAEAELATGGHGAALSELEVERDAAEQFGRAVARRTQELWRVGLAFVARGESRLRMEAVRARLAERLAGLGFRTRVPRFEVLDALAGPGVEGEVRRPTGYWQTLPTDGVAALYPFVDESILQERGILLGLALADASPVFLDRYAHASHSWALFGTTGSGKSFFGALVVLRTRWMYPDLQVVFLDPLGEYVRLTRALGGRVVSVADGCSRINPLDPATTGGDRVEKAARVGTMLRAIFPSLTDEETALLDRAVSRLYERSVAPPTFLELERALEQEDGTVGGRLRALMGVFHSGSLRGADAAGAPVPDGPLIDLDLRGVPEDHLAFHLTYLLDWVYGRLRSRPGPKLVVLDEAHLLMRRGPTAEFLDRVVRHVRHFEGGFLLLTQSPDDFLAHPSGKAVLRNLYATGFLRLPEVSAEARAFFGLTGPESEWIPRARLPRDASYAESLWRIGELHLPLAIVASTDEYLFLTDVAARSDPPSADAREAGPL